MEKRAFLAVFLSVLILILYQYFYISRYDTQKIQPEGTKKVEQGGKPPDKELIPAITEDEKIKDIVVEEREIRVNTGVTEVVLSNRGGKLRAINLQRHKTKDAKPINLIKKTEGTSLPIKLEFPDKKLSDTLNSTLFEVKDTENIINLSSDKKEITVRFHYTDGSGFEISKEYTFHHNDYKIGVNIKIDGGTLLPRDFSYQVLWGPGLESDGNSTKYSYEGPAIFINKNLTTDKLKEKGEQIYHEGDIKWVAVQNKYFMVALIPLINENLKAIIKTSDIGDLSVGLEHNSFNGKGDNSFILYAGPKEADRLESYNVSLEKIINYGWFSFLARPLFKVLKLFYKFTHNYGISIIILTVIIKAIFFPLSQKSFKSMKKMQKIQPELKIIQERYKNDKQKLSMEMMRLYRENKINPFGGIFPILIQIPVFIALYNVLMYSIELRQAHFIWWIKDLSDKDPYYITPILMGATMLIQQKMTPSGGDPMQAKVMLIMPIIFTVMFLSFPSGLVLYWLVNNVLSISQQYVIQKEGTKT